MLSRFSHVWLFAVPPIVSHWAPLSMEYSRQEYWSGLPCSSQGDLPHSGFKPKSFMSPALAGGFFTTNATWEAPQYLQWDLNTSRSHLGRCGSTKSTLEHTPKSGIIWTSYTVNIVGIHAKISKGGRPGKEEQNTGSGWACQNGLLTETDSVFWIQC